MRFDRKNTRKQAYQRLIAYATSTLKLTRWIARVRGVPYEMGRGTVVDPSLSVEVELGRVGGMWPVCVCALW